jgi:site-specific DNA-methyltransferase (adenine-specific)
VIYHQTEHGILYHGDCLDILPTLADKSVDLVLTDCPYKIVAGGMSVEYNPSECGGILNKRFISYGTDCSNKWIKKNPANVPSAVKNGKMFEHNDILFSEWLPDMFRLSKMATHTYIMINGRNITELQIESEKAGYVFQNILVWDKGNYTPNKYYMQGIEFILLLSKRPARNINNMGSGNLISIPNIIGNKEHPTEKPVALMSLFINNSTDTGQLILDPFAGSGTTAVACINTKRRYILIEKEEKYCEISARRIETALDQTEIEI